MNPVWLSRDSWEKIWYALHNIQIRIGCSIQQAAASLTGSGCTARLLIDLPEHTGQNLLWQCRIREEENGLYYFKFFSFAASDPKHIHWHGKRISLGDTLYFRISRSDLESGKIYAVLVRTIDMRTRKISFSLALTRYEFTRFSDESRFGLGVCPIAEVSFQNGYPSIKSYYHSTIEWPDIYSGRMFHAAMAFSDVIRSDAGFQDFLTGAKHHLAISELFSMCINNCHTVGTRNISSFVDNPYSILEPEPRSLNPLYVFLSAEIGGNTFSGNCREPVGIHYEIETRIDTARSSSFNGNLRIPAVMLKIVEADSKRFCTIASEKELPNFPVLWINTFGMELSPSEGGFISVDFERKRMIVNPIYCCFNGNLTSSSTISYAGSYENFPAYGPLYVCCRYNLENNQWSHAWLQLGNLILSNSGDPNSGTLYRQQIAYVQHNQNGNLIVTMQNFSKYVFFSSAHENNSHFLTRLERLDTKVDNLQIKDVALSDQVYALSSRISQLENKVNILERQI